MRFDDLPLARVVKLKRDKESCSETKAYVLAIAPVDSLHHRRIHDKSARIEPPLRLDRPPNHVKECLLRKAFFLRLRFYKVTGPLHNLATIAQPLSGRHPLTVAQLKTRLFVSFPPATANG